MQNIRYRISRCFVLITIVGSAALISDQSRADEVYTFVVKKQEEKRQSRWSLSQWLETRDRMRMMDLWLALHSPSPYEYFIDGQYYSLTQNGGSSMPGSRFSIGAFATIFGLELQRELGPIQRWHGLFHLRVFGYHDQGTNITAQIGLSANADGSNHRNLIVGGRLTMYFTTVFGIQGLYRNYFGSTPGSDGSRISGYRLEGQIFIEFSLLRIYGGYFSAPQTVEGGGTTEISAEAWEAGARLYF